MRAIRDELKAAMPAADRFNLDVLLLEDSPGEARLFSDWLTGASGATLQVTVAERLPAGLERLARQPFDVVLLDLSLPGSQILETVQTVAAHSPAAPIVVLTGADDEQLALQTLQLGAQDYLVKERLGPDLLVRSIRYAIERRRQQAELQANERRFRALIENSADAIALVSPDGTLLYDSPAAPGLLGYGAGTLLGRDLFDFIHPDDHAAGQTFVASLLGQPASKARVDVRFRHGNGSWRWLEATGSNLLDEPSVGAIVLNYRDVTEQRLAEQRLVESEKRYRAIVEGQTELICRWQPDGTYTFVNEAMCRYYGRQPDEILGRKGVVLSVPEDYDLWQATAADVDRSGPIASYEVRTIVGDEVRWLQWTDRPVFDDAGNLVEFQSVGRDVTERRRAEVEKEQAARMLGQRVKELSLLHRAARVLQDASLTPRETLREIVHALPSAWQYPKTAAARIAFDNMAAETPNYEPSPWRQIAEFMTSDGRQGLVEVVYLQERPAEEDGPFLAEERSTLNAVADMLRSYFDRSRAEDERRRRTEEFAALYETSRDLAIQHDLPAFLQTIVERAMNLLSVDGGTMFLFDTARQDLEIVVSVNMPAPVGWRRPLGVGMSGQAALRRETLLVNDYQNWPERSPEFEGTAVRAMLHTPMLYAGELLGVLSMAETRPGRHFTEADSHLLSLFAAQAAGAVLEAQRLEAMRRRLADLEAVNRVSSALRAAQTLDEMLPILLDETLGALSAPAGVIALFDPASQLLKPAVSRGWFAQVNLSHTPGEGIGGSVFATGEPFLTREFKRSSQTSEAARPRIPEGWGGACVPIRAAQEIVGVQFVSVQLPREIGQLELGVLTTLAEIAGNAIQRTRLHQQTEQRLQRLAGLRAMDVAISASLDLRVTLDVLLDQVTSRLEVDAAAVLTLNPFTQELEYAAGRGFRGTAITRTRSRLGTGLAGRAALERRLVSLPASAGDADVLRRGSLTDEGFVSQYIAPLLAKGHVKGVLEVFHRALLDPDPEWLEFLEALAGQAAIAIDSAQLFDSLQRSNLELALAYDATIEGWSHALDLRDRETEGHTLRVTDLSIRLAKAVGVRESELIHLRRGALLHDIGKMGIPDSILLKPGPLTDDEWAIMRQHPQFALDMLSRISYLHASLDIPYCHHERWDGSGYPRGLKGEDIPLAARIFAVVDVWDALRSDRPYRPAWPDDQVREYLQKRAGSQFDPTIVVEFLNLLEEDSLVVE
jgi:PAS domain S-box-containing protein